MNSKINESCCRQMMAWGFNWESCCWSQLFQTCRDWQCILISPGRCNNKYQHDWWREKTQWHYLLIFVQYLLHGNRHIGAAGCWTLIKCYSSTDGEMVKIALEIEQKWVSEGKVFLLVTWLSSTDSKWMLDNSLGSTLLYTGFLAEM